MTLLPIPNSVILSDRHCTENYLRNIIYVDIKFHDLLTHWPWAPRTRRRACAVWCPRTLRTTPTWPRWSRCKCSCAPVQRAFPSWDPWHWNFNHFYRVNNQLANLGWVDWFWLFHCLPDSGWADESWAELAEQLGNMGGTYRWKSTQPRSTRSTRPTTKMCQRQNNFLPRKRYEHERRLPGNRISPLQVHVLWEGLPARVVQRDPSVLGLQTELFLGRVQADKCLESAPARSQLCRQLVEIGLLGYIFGQQLLECVFEPRIRYYTRSFDVVDLSADDRYPCCINYWNYNVLLSQYSDNRILLWHCWGMAKLSQ